ncbi:MAG: GNAT family N-acetyltransferase [Candidatus Aenigmatarchaeota archaeon]
MNQFYKSWDRVKIPSCRSFLLKLDEKIENGFKIKLYESLASTSISRDRFDFLEYGEPPYWMGIIGEFWLNYKDLNPKIECRSERSSFLRSHVYIIATSALNDKLIGGVWYEPLQRYKNITDRTFHILVSLDMRNNGCGKTLLKNAEKYARSDILSCEWDVHDKERDSCNEYFFKKYGYTISVYNNYKRAEKRLR